MVIIVGWAAGGRGHSVALTEAGAATAPPLATRIVPLAQLPGVIAAREASGPKPRWVWHDTAQWYPALLAAGVTIERCHDHH